MIDIKSNKQSMTKFSLQGYGYSVWYVPTKPLQLTHIKQRYQLQHIPHVTVATNMNFSEAAMMMQRMPQRVMFQANDPLTYFPSLYGTNTLHGFGFYGSLWDISDDTFATVELKWQPRIALQYFNDPHHHGDKHMCSDVLPVLQFALRYPVECEKCIANTLSFDPTEWKPVIHSLSYT